MPDFNIRFDTAFSPKANDAEHTAAFATIAAASSVDDPSSAVCSSP